MIGMRYQVILPKDYDMDVIKKRVRDNGHKMDGFPGLHFKAYLITEAEKNGNLYNSYAPLYLWNDTQAMNRFIFEGFYDNILDSFGWQHIQIGVPFSIDLHNDFQKSRYIVESAGGIAERKSFVQKPFHPIQHDVNDTGGLLGTFSVYNPDKWGYSHFSFYEEKPVFNHSGQRTLHEILHLSQGSEVLCRL